MIVNLYTVSMLLKLILRLLIIPVVYCMCVLFRIPDEDSLFARILLLSGISAHISGKTHRFNPFLFCFVFVRVEIRGILFVYSI